jgi:hypothetical protein
MVIVPAVALSQSRSLRLLKEFGFDHRPQYRPPNRPLSFADAHGGRYNLCGDSQFDPEQEVEAVSRSRSGKCS